MHNPELHALARIDWQLFCTFTFKSERKSDAIRQSMFFALLRTQAKVWKVHFKRLLWCLRRESGESTGRLHYHAIIAGLPPQAVTERNCLAMMSQWESVGGGMARVRAYDSSLDGLDYVLKGSELTESKATVGPETITNSASLKFLACPKRRAILLARGASASAKSCGHERFLRRSLTS